MNARLAQLGRNLTRKVVETLDAAGRAQNQMAAENHDLVVSGSNAAQAKTAQAATAFTKHFKK